MKAFPEPWVASERIDIMILILTFNLKQSKIFIWLNSV